MAKWTSDSDYMQGPTPADDRSETLIYLVRHGETTWNRDQRFQGQEDAPLSDLGLRQADVTAAYMASMGLSAIYTSDLSRAQMTAEAIARAAGIPDVIPTAALREAHFGAWQGMTIEEVHAAYPQEASLWKQDSVAYRAPGGETLEEVFERSVALFREALPRHLGQRIAVVAHGGPIKALVCHTLGAPLGAFRHFRLDNCSITTLRYGSDENLILIGLNSVSHLDPCGSL